MQECKHQASKISIHFCPFCGLIADISRKGIWVWCHHCDIGFHLFVKDASTKTWGEGKIFDACKRKVRYHDLGEALKAFHEMDADGRTKQIANPMVIYLCDICGMYHLGHDFTRSGFKAKFWTIEAAELECKND